MLLNRILILLLFFSMILCGNVLSQSSFLLGDRNLTLVSDYDFTHGFGVEPLSRYDANKSYNKACKSALQELNSNKFLSVYIEEFKTGAYSDYSFPELSVRDSVLSFGEHIVKADSFDVAGQAYCIATIKDDQFKKIDTIPSLDKLSKGPVKVDGVWYALGIEKGSSYNHYVPWIKSKNNALQDLSRTIVTLIQSSVINLDYIQTELTYFKSNVIYNDIVVARRFISSDNELISVIAVKESDISDY